jgi:predicted metal-binding membrane protein
LISGYLAVWLGFGLVAHIFDWGLHELVEAVPYMEVNAWIFGAAVLIVAGAFQFSSLKYRCLDKCRAPLSFLSQHWRGTAQSTQAFLLGAHHGLFCVGCCWALMLLMFAVGTGNVGWMMGLGAIMAIEKNVSWGRRLSAPLGVGLLAWGFAIAAANTGAFDLLATLAG